jgi:hypothetical protein
MTKKIAISIPDDVAERLAAGDIENVSAYVTEAVRRQIEIEKVRQELADAGFTITQEGVDRWRKLLAERRARVDPQMWDRTRARLTRMARSEG